MKTFASLALLIVAVAAGAPPANADAVSDQKKAYKAMGIDLSKNKPAQCHLLAKAEVERFLGKPVRDGTSAGPVVSGCAWYAADGSGDGVLVTRGPSSDWYPPRNYKPIAGVGNKSYTKYDATLGSEASALSSKGVTDVLIHRSGNNTGAAVAALKAALKR